jgi:hypothetical protein
MYTGAVAVFRVTEPEAMVVALPRVRVPVLTICRWLLRCLKSGL